MKSKKKKIYHKTNECSLIYNKIDNRFYIYIGEDYYHDTTNWQDAILKFDNARSDLVNK